MATITFNRTVDTDPNNTDTFVYVYTPNEPGLTTKTFVIERDVYYDVDAREAIFLGEWLLAMTLVNIMWMVMVLYLMKKNAI